MTRILVTGGAGYVGSHCCKALSCAGFEPVVLDNLSTGHRDAVRWGPLIEGDIGDADALTALLRDVRPAAVMHFAALSLVDESVAQPERYARANVEGTRNLLRAMLAAGSKALVFSSSCAVYGHPEAIPISEDAPLRPVNPYGETKLACEQLMQEVDRRHGLRSIRLRYFNAAGADPEAEIGERHEPETHLIPLALDAALGRCPAVRIYGTDYPTPDGTALRDYVHVTDLAEAHVTSLRRLLERGESCALNLGTGRGVSVREIVTAVEAVCGTKVPTMEAPRRAGDLPALVADPSRAEAALGWRARRDLAAAIADAWRWRRQLRARQDGLSAAP